MSKSALKLAKKATYEQVTNNPYTIINGQPTREDYHVIREEAIESLAAFDNPYEEAN